MPSFHTIDFNQHGISLISARRQSKSKERTYNSVGKSLSIYLIQFCLGAKSTKDFTDKLPGWAFRLDFKLKDGLHYTYRTSENTKVIVFDGNEMKVKSFNKMMGYLIFGLMGDEQFLSYRTLITRFIRQGKSGYTSFDRFQPKETTPTDIINTSYLLGLDVNRLLHKVQLKLDDDLLKTQEKNLAKDPVMRSLLLGTGRAEDIDLRLLDLDKQIEKLQEDINSFVIAEDYGEIKNEADAISMSLYQWRNKASKCRIALENVSKSMQHRPDIKKQNLLNFFEEAKVSLGEMVVKHLEDVERFNERLLDDRSRILAEQQSRYEQQLAEAETKINVLEQQENEKLQYLNSHGALDDYTLLTELIADYRSKKEKLEQYKILQKSYKQKREELKRTIADENLKTQVYLDNISDLVNRHMVYFHDMVRTFYSDKTAGLQIINNEGVNKQRFNIVARISDDSGDGVNETKIFCFDWTLLTAQLHHEIKFLVHDSRIISETDPRQVATMLRNANRICNEDDVQYILTVNESSLDMLKKEMTEDEYKTLVIDREVLKLTDFSDSDKLLGIQVDLKYEFEK